MKRAAEKLNSRRGASLLLALTFVLVCVMVGISILSAAASNAGRTRSNHEEQQLYLSLSSALQLVADDMSNASYTPKVADDCPVIPDPHIVGKDEEGHDIIVTYYIYNHTFSHAKGDMEGSPLDGLFLDKLDNVFDNYMSGRSFPPSNSGYDTYNYSNGYTSVPVPITLTLTVEPEGLPVTEDKDTYHAAQPVAVDVEIDEYYNITLTARLARDDADDYAKSFRLSTVLTRSSASLPKITIPTTDTSPTISASPTVTWKQGVVESAYVTGGVSP